MAQRNTPPFRADHVGSLLRPKSIPEAFKNFNKGDIGQREFTAIQNDAIRDVIKLQEDVGLKAVTDGEFRRASYWSSFVEKVDGLEVRESLFTFHDDHGHEQNFTAPHVTGKVRRSQPIAVDEFSFVFSATRETAKITLPSPPTMHFLRLGQGVEKSAYETDQEYFTDLGKVYAKEIDQLAGQGATYVQLDDIVLPMLCDPALQQKVAGLGIDPQQLIDDYVDLFNDAIGGRPANVSAAIHLCRGNYKGQYLSSGGYEAIADRLFNNLQADAFFMEYDSDRAGDFAPLRFVPDNVTVVLGLVSSKTAEMENMDDLRRRIDEAAKYIDLDQLALSPQCGFASTVAGNPITLDVQKAKLALIVATAEKVWG